MNGGSIKFSGRQEPILASTLTLVSGNVVASRYSEPLAAMLRMASRALPRGKCTRLSRLRIASASGSDPEIISVTAKVCVAGSGFSLFWAISSGTMSTPI